MTIEEFRERYEGNLGRHTANYTEWFIVRSRDDIYRILEWYSNRPGELKNCGKQSVKGVIYSTHSPSELTFSYNAALASLFSVPHPGHFVRLDGDVYLDGYTEIRGNDLLPMGSHVILHLLDNHPFCALGRGSIAVMTEACLEGREEPDPPQCWPSKHRFRDGVCSVCGLSRCIPREMKPEK